MTRIIVANSSREMEPLKPVWQALHHAGEYTIFQSFEFNLLAAKHFAGREAACVVLVETEGGAAIVPAAISKKCLTLLGEELFDYRDVLSIGDKEALSMAWKAFSEVDGVAGLPFSVKGVRSQSLGFDTNHVESTFFANAPFVNRNAALLPCPRLARNLERMRMNGCELKVCSGRNVSLVRAILELKAAQHETNLFRDSLRIEMVCAMAQIQGDSCEVFTIENGSCIVAALVTFIDRDCRRLYSTYYDKSWAKYSPGVSLLHHVIKISRDAGLDVDLMTGEQPYKTRFATGKKPLYTLQAASLAHPSMPHRAMKNATEPGNGAALTEA